MTENNIKLSSSSKEFAFHLKNHANRTISHVANTSTPAITTSFHSKQKAKSAKSHSEIERTKKSRGGKLQKKGEFLPPKFQNGIDFVVMDSLLKVKSASVEKLLLLLTFDCYIDIETYQQEFFATYTKFMQDEEILNHLRERFANATADISKLRVLHAIRTWILFNEERFQSTVVHSLRNNLEQFLKEIPEKFQTDLSLIQSILFNISIKEEKISPKVAVMQKPTSPRTQSPKIEETNSPKPRSRGSSISLHTTPDIPETISSPKVNRISSSKSLLSFKDVGDLESIESVIMPSGRLGVNTSNSENSKDEINRIAVGSQFQFNLFITLTTQDIAEQFTLISHNLLCKIKAREILSQGWVKKDENGKLLGENISRFIDWFNKESQIISNSIIREDSSIQRTRLIVRFIDVAQECLTLKNYSTSMAIFSALNSSPVQRLKTSWIGVPVTHWKILKNIESFFNFQTNFAECREEMKNSSPPSVPHIGILTKDLTFVEENPTILENGLINFMKCSIIGSTICLVRKFQTNRYHFEKLDYFETFLRSVEILSEDELWDLSVKKEKRSHKESKSDRNSDYIFAIGSSIKSLFIEQIPRTIMDIRVNLEDQLSPTSKEILDNQNLVYHNGSARSLHPKSKSNFSKSVSPRGAEKSKSLASDIRDRKPIQTLQSPVAYEPEETENKKVKKKERRATISFENGCDLSASTMDESVMLSALLSVIEEKKNHQQPNSNSHHHHHHNHNNNNNNNNNSNPHGNFLNQLNAMSSTENITITPTPSPTNTPVSHALTCKNSPNSSANSMSNLSQYPPIIHSLRATNSGNSTGYTCERKRSNTKKPDEKKSDVSDIVKEFLYEYNSNVNASIAKENKLKKKDSKTKDKHSKESSSSSNTEQPKVFAPPLLGTSESDLEIMLEKKVTHDYDYNNITFDKLKDVEVEEDCLSRDDDDDSLSRSFGNGNERHTDDDMIIFDDNAVFPNLKPKTKIKSKSSQSEPQFSPLPPPRKKSSKKKKKKESEGGKTVSDDVKSPRNAEEPRERRKKKKYATVGGPSPFSATKAQSSNDDFKREGKSAILSHTSSSQTSHDSIHNSRKKRKKSSEVTTELNNNNNNNNNNSNTNINNHNNNNNTNNPSKDQDNNNGSTPSSPKSPKLETSFSLLHLRGDDKSKKFNSTSSVSNFKNNKDVKSLLRETDGGNNHKSRKFSLKFKFPFKNTKNDENDK